MIPTGVLNQLLLKVHYYVFVLDIFLFRKNKQGVGNALKYFIFEKKKSRHPSTHIKNTTCACNECTYG